MSTTTDALRKVIVKARYLSAVSTQRRNKYSVSAYVPWRALEELRAALEAAGYDLAADRKLIELEYPHQIRGRAQS